MKSKGIIDAVIFGTVLLAGSYSLNGCHRPEAGASQSATLAAKQSSRRAAKPDAQPPGQSPLLNPGTPKDQWIATAPPLTPDEERATFTLPPGFEIQLVASEPDIQKPMQLAFDEKGRLLVSGSTDYPLGPAPGKQPSDKVMALEIDGETGRATKVSGFAEGFNICSAIEALPGGGVIVAQAPDIYLLEDKNGDGKARREDGEWKTLYTGFAREDTHEIVNSFTWGIDGWLYGLQGLGNDSNVKDLRGNTVKIHRSNVFRLLPDGSKIEVWAKGMSNPWGLAFNEENCLFATDCESRPLWQIVDGGAYPGLLAVEDGIGPAPFIFDHTHHSSGFAGLVSYSGENFPDDFTDNLFTGNPITHTINRDSLEARGSTFFTVHQPDLLFSTDPWFRPVDLEQGPDGALYVADWYNRIIAHVEVPLDHPDRDKSRGRIWRIVHRKEGSERRAGPMDRDYSQMKEDELIRELEDPNLWRRRMASRQLAQRGRAKEIAKPFRKLLTRSSAPAIARAEALWLLKLTDALGEKDLRRALRDPSPIVQLYATRILSGMPEGKPKFQRFRETKLIENLFSPSGLVAREAAIAVRDHPGAEELAALLRLLGDIPAEDTLLDYAARMSARDLMSNDKVMDARVRWMPAAADDAMLTGLLAATPSAAACRILGERLKAGSVSAAARPGVLANALAHGDADTLRSVFIAPFQTADAVQSKPEDEIRDYVRVFAQASRRADKHAVDLTPSLKLLVQRLAASQDVSSRRIALLAGSKEKLAEVSPLAEALLDDSNQAENIRKEAADTLMAIDPESARKRLAAIIADPKASPGFRSRMATTLGAAAKSAAMQSDLMNAIKTAPSQAWRGAVDGLLRHREGTEFLLAQAEAGNLNPVYLNDHFIGLRIEGYRREGFHERWKKVTERAETFDEEMDRLIARRIEAFKGRPERNLVNGQIVWEKNCSVCHRIGNLGVERGPHMDGVGARGLERLMQDILTPNRNVDPGFRRLLIRLKGGDSDSGLIIRTEAKEIAFINEEGEERRIQKDRIESTEPLWTSIMPSGFESGIPEEDFYDLIAFLINPPGIMKRLTGKKTP